MKKTPCIYWYFSSLPFRRRGQTGKTSSTSKSHRKSNNHRKIQRVCKMLLNQASQPATLGMMAIKFKSHSMCKKISFDLHKHTLARSHTHIGFVCEKHVRFTIFRSNSQTPLDLLIVCVCFFFLRFIYSNPFSTISAALTMTLISEYYTLKYMVIGGDHTAVSSDIVSWWCLMMIIMLIALIIPFSVSVRLFFICIFN